MFKKQKLFSGEEYDWEIKRLWNVVWGSESRIKKLEKAIDNLWHKQAQEESSALFAAWLAAVERQEVSTNLQPEVDYGQAQKKAYNQGYNAGHAKGYSAAELGASDYALRAELAALLNLHIATLRNQLQRHLTDYLLPNAIAVPEKYKSVADGTFLGLPLKAVSSNLRIHPYVTAIRMGSV